MVTMLRTILPFIVTSMLLVIGCARPSGATDTGTDRGLTVYTVDSAGNNFGIMIGDEVSYVERYKSTLVVDLKTGIRPDYFPCGHQVGSVLGACFFANRFLDASCTIPQISVGTEAADTGTSILLVGRTGRVYAIKDQAHALQQYYSFEAGECNFVESLGDESYLLTSLKDITDTFSDLSSFLPLTMRYP
jgi:hypothetical protein